MKKSRPLFLMKRLIIVFIFLALIFLGANFWWQKASAPAAKQGSWVSFVIPKGSSAGQIANLLAQKKLIKSPLAFKIYIQLTGQAEKIQTGEYRLSPTLSLVEIVTLFTKGPVEVWVTIPEGLRREQVVERFIKGLDKQGQEAEEFRSSFLSLSTELEGFLFPDTYLFPKSASASAVIQKMTKTFEKKTAQFNEKALANRPIDSLKEAVILASIIERESFSDQERPIIAGILFNRLEIGMGLQADATVQYAVASRNCRAKIDCNWWPVLTKADMKIDSLFNTYKYRGLPPRAIASPGLSSIKAVFYPKATDYLYYLHDKKGQIRYAKTFEEHKQNIARYLR